MDAREEMSLVSPASGKVRPKNNEKLLHEFKTVETKKINLSYVAFQFF